MDFYVLRIKLFTYCSSFNSYNYHIKYHYPYFMDEVPEA